MTDKTFRVCLCTKSTSSGINVLLQKFFSMLFGMLSLCCLVSSVVDHMLLISGGFLMVVHRLFWGYSLVTLCYFVVGGTASSSCYFVSSVVFLLFFHFLVYSVVYM